jgi:transposase
VARDLSDLSRVVSHALRHQPQLYELELEEDGWTDVTALLTALHQESPSWMNLSERDLAEMIRTSSKRRHEIADGRIRALYGHSLPGKLRRERAAPPSCLLHGTAPASGSKIKQEGLLPMGRNKRRVDLREVRNGVMYILGTGCQWRALPKDFPPRSTVHGYFKLWQYDGTLDNLHHLLYVECRRLADREASPTAAIIDSQSVKSAEKGGSRSIRMDTTRARKSKEKSATSL